MSRRVAVVRRNGFGDLLCALPLLQLLHEKGERTTLFLDARNAPLAPFLPPFLEEVVVFPSGNKYLSLLRTALRYRSRHFDLALSARGGPMKLVDLMLFALGARERRAYALPSWHSRLLTHPVPYCQAAMVQKHQALKNIQLLFPEIEEVPERLYPSLSIECERTEDPFYATSDPILSLSTSVNSTSCRLPPERYVALLNSLFQTRPFRVAIHALPSDRPAAEAIASKLKMPCRVDLPQSFRGFLQALQRSTCSLLSNGGTAHLMAALGKPGVALFGGASPQEWRPLSSRVSTLFHPEGVEALPNSDIENILKKYL